MVRVFQSAFSLPLDLVIFYNPCSDVYDFFEKESAESVILSGNVRYRLYQQNSTRAGFQLGFGAIICLTCSVLNVRINSIQSSTFFDSRCCL